MEMNWSIAVWISIVIILYLVGYYEGRAAGYRKRKKEEEQEALKNPPAPQDAAQSGDLPGDKKEFMPDPVILPAAAAAYPAAFDPTPGNPDPLPPVIPTPRLTHPIHPAAPKPASVAKEDRPVSSANSIVGQIDSILQEQISGTPLEERGVFIAESPGGGVMVYVGLNKYNGVEEVPDAEIKSAIRFAIAEWEKKYTPGL